MSLYQIGNNVHGKRKIYVCTYLHNISFFILNKNVVLFQDTRDGIDMFHSIQEPSLCNGELSLTSIKYYVWFELVIHVCLVSRKIAEQLKCYENGEIIIQPRKYIEEMNIDFRIIRKNEEKDKMFPEKYAYKKMRSKLDRKSGQHV